MVFSVAESTLMTGGTAWMTALAYVLTILPISALVVMFLVVTAHLSATHVLGPGEQATRGYGFPGIVVGFLCGVLGEGAGFGCG